MEQSRKDIIYFILSSLEAGGAERVFSILIDNFDTERYDVYLIILDNSNQFFQFTNKNFTIIDLGIDRAYKSFWKLFREIRKRNPDVIYCTGTHVNVIVGLLRMVFLRQKKTRFIARQSNIPDLIRNYSNLKSRLVNLFIRSLYNKFDFIVCQSVEMRNSLRDLYHVDNRRLAVISNPVRPFAPTKLEKTSNLKKNMICIGRINTVKGHERLIDTFSELDKNYHLSIFGNGVLKESLQYKIREAELDGRVKVHSAIENVQSEISKNDVLIISSFTEGFPNVALEALSVGVPIVSYEVGGIKEIIRNGFNGYVIAQNDAEGFKNAIIRASENKWNKEEIIKDVNERFSIERIVAEYCNLITK